MQEWHAVLHAMTIYLFLSTSENEWSSIHVNLVYSWLEELPHYGDGEEYFFAIRQMEGTRESYLFAAPSESEFRAWSRAIHSVTNSSEKTASGTPKEKPLVRMASDHQSPNLLRHRLNRTMSDSMVTSPRRSDPDTHNDQIESIEKGNSSPSSSLPSSTEVAKQEGVRLKETFVETTSDEDLPSIFRVPQEEVEGVGLSLASYQLLDPSKVGFLYKRGHVVKRWSRRYFVLKGHKMFYFRDITDRTCAGIIQLRDCVKPRLSSFGSKFPFGIGLYNMTTERDYVLAAGSFIERKGWYEAILGCMPERYWQSPHRLSQVNFDDEPESHRSSASVHSHDSGWTGPRLEGHVLKLRKKQLISAWKPRYFVLRDGILKSFTSDKVMERLESQESVRWGSADSFKKEETPKTVWSADQLHAARAAAQGGQKHLFQLRAITGTKQVSYMIAVSTDAEAQQWVDAINDTKKEMEVEREQILRKWAGCEVPEPNRPRSNFLSGTQRNVGNE